MNIFLLSIVMIIYLVVGIKYLYIKNWAMGVVFISYSASIIGLMMVKG